MATLRTKKGADLMKAGSSREEYIDVNINFKLSYDIGVEGVFVETPTGGYLQDQVYILYKAGGSHSQDITVRTRIYWTYTLMEGGIEDNVFLAKDFKGSFFTHSSTNYEKTSPVDYFERSILTDADAATVAKSLNMPKIKFKDGSYDQNEVYWGALIKGAMINNGLLISYVSYEVMDLDVYSAAASNDIKSGDIFDAIIIYGFKEMIVPSKIDNRTGVVNSMPEYYPVRWYARDDRTAIPNPVVPALFSGTASPFDTANALQALNAGKSLVPIFFTMRRNNLNSATPLPWQDDLKALSAGKMVQF